VAAKIRGQGTFDSALSEDDVLHHVEVALNIRTAKSINRLLRVTDHEYFARLKLDRPPLGRALPGFFREVEKNLVLNRIRILKFVYENGFERVFQLFAQMLVIAQEIPGTDQ